MTKDSASKLVPAIYASGEPRIGVFICHCGTNIAGFLDVEDVTEYSRTLPDGVFATGNLYTCAEDGIIAIKDAIKEYNLNRVVVASCKPRTHELSSEPRARKQTSTSTFSSSRIYATSASGCTCKIGTRQRPRPGTSCS